MVASKTALLLLFIYVKILLENNKSCWFLKQPRILPFLCHKSATTCHIDSYKVSNSKLKPDLSSCVKTEMIEPTTPPQQPYKQGTFFWTPCTEPISLSTAGLLVSSCKGERYLFQYSMFRKLTSRFLDTKQNRCGRC